MDKNESINKSAVAIGAVPEGVEIKRDDGKMTFVSRSLPYTDEIGRKMVKFASMNSEKRHDKKAVMRKLGITGKQYRKKRIKEMRQPVMCKKCFAVFKSGQGQCPRCGSHEYDHISLKKHGLKHGVQAQKIF